MARGIQESTKSMPKQTARPDYSIPKTLCDAPRLPTELWLQILEFDDPKHLWLSVRNVSRAFRGYVERLFTSGYLHRLRVALSLPRRDPATSKLKWRGDPIPQSQLVMTYTQLSEDGERIHFESPTVLKDRNGEKTLEGLKDVGTLPKERLEEAPTIVNMSRHPMASLAVSLPVHVDWDNTRKIWVWEVEWRGMLSRFYIAKDRQGKRWPTSASGTMHRGHPWRSRQV